MDGRGRAAQERGTLGLRGVIQAMHTACIVSVVGGVEGGMCIVVPSCSFFSRFHTCFSLTGNSVKHMWVRLIEVNADAAKASYNKSGAGDVGIYYLNKLSQDICDEPTAKCCGMVVTMTKLWNVFLCILV